MIFVCLIVLMVVAVLVMEQWWGKDVDGVLSDRVRMSMAAIKA
ncbi:MAG: hypothetical protein JWQ41_2133 [Variovorax sp.]|nr:hypothetical protein [Variovorax sp.]